ncbi:hypothetical protein F383_30385 [Gossypium arboreum]|uniref:Uncharacterized protein n=1 Tax=Gossypium arboreum TaxID=29729 RepID=A0A0B0N1X6_GOSAR|nr:hypothetical protein F383_30385 [Gossypium arboreum]
MSCGTRVSLAV